MIESKNLKNVKLIEREHGVILSDTEYKYFKEITKKRKMETLNGQKALSKFDKK